MRTRTEITFEMDRVIVIGRHGSSVQWCADCHERVDMMTTDQAAIIARVNSRTIFRWADSGRLHSSETPEGLLLICPNSL
jgi:hypothetical protein